MLNDIQSRLNEIATKTDNRTSVFEIAIDALDGHHLKLTGRVLNAAQLDELQRLFPNLKMDISAVKILNRPNLPHLAVATNLTGLYEKPTFGMPLSSELYYGTDLEILDEHNRWVFTRQKDGYLGWAYRPYLDEGGDPETHLILAPAVELRAQADAQSEVLTRLVSGTGVGLKEKRGDWACVSANQTGWVPASVLRAIADIPASIEEKRNLIVTDAMRMTGVPYLWGGTSGNGIDCSGYVRLLHRWVGVEIPRDADMQCHAAKPVEKPFEVGDLFFFSEGDDEKRSITHVGMSLGGWKMIHSSRGRNGVYIDDLQKNESLMKIYSSAGSFLR